MGRTIRICDRARDRGGGRRAAAAALLGGLAAILAGCAGGLPTGFGPGAASPRETAAGAYLAARQAYKAFDARAADGLYANALDHDPKNADLQRRALAARLEIGRYAAAIRLAEQLAAADADSVLARLVLIAKATSEGDHGAAQRQIAMLPEAGSFRILRPLLLAWSAAAEGRHEDAMAAIEPLRGQQGLAALYQTHAAYLAELAGAADVAARFETALDREGVAPVQFRLAAAARLARAGDRAGATALFVRTGGGEAPSPAIIAALDRVAAGETVADILRTPADGMAEAFYGIARAIRRNHGGVVALAHARLAVMLRPGFAPARILIGEILDQRKRHAEALDAYRGVAAGSPFRQAARLQAAGSLQRLGRIDEAIGLLRVLAREQPENPRPLARLGDLFRAEERWQEAVAAYDAAVPVQEAATGPDWLLYYRRGIALERAKQWPRAEADLLKALELEPNQAYVMNYLGYSWAEQGINLKRAQTLIEKAVGLEPKDGYIVDSLGWVLYRAGRYEEAVRHLERAVELRPVDPTINDHLGDAYWHVGRRSEAEYQWRRTLTMDPEPELAAAVRRKLTGDPPAGSPVPAGGNPDGAPGA